MLALDRTELHSARNTKDFVTPFAVEEEESFMHPTLLIVTYLSRASHKVTPERNSKAEQNLQGRAEDENYFVFTTGNHLGGEPD